MSWITHRLNTPVTARMKKTLVEISEFNELGDVGVTEHATASLMTAYDNLWPREALYYVAVPGFSVFHLHSLYQHIKCDMPDHMWPAYWSALYRCAIEDDYESDWVWPQRKMLAPWLSPMAPALSGAFVKSWFIISPLPVGRRWRIAVYDGTNMYRISCTGNSSESATQTLRGFAWAVPDFVTLNSRALVLE